MYNIVSVCSKYHTIFYLEQEVKEQLRATIVKSAETVHLILLCYLCDTIRCAVSDDLKMVVRSRHLGQCCHF